MRYTDFGTPLLDEVMRVQGEWPLVNKNHASPINATIGVLIDPAHSAEFQPETISIAIREALNRVQKIRDRGYQSQAGNTEYLQGIAEWMIGHHEMHWPQAQVLSGTGALHLASDLLFETTDIKNVLIDPGWNNHNAIFSEFELLTYQRIIDGHPGYDHKVYMDALSALPENSGVILQAVGYNNDGHDRTPAQWDEIIELLATKQLFAVLDMAYFGLSESFEKDHYAIRSLARSSVPSMIAISNSKNLGLYQERLGALFALNIPEVRATAWQAKLNTLIRAHYSNPPRLIASAVASVLKEPSTLRQLETEISDIRENVLVKNRQVLAEVLGEDYAWIGDTKGLFLKLHVDGFSEAQRDKLKSQGILVMPSARLNIGAIPPAQIERFSNAIKQVL